MDNLPAAPEFNEPTSLLVLKRRAKMGLTLQLVSEIREYDRAAANYLKHAQESTQYQELKKAWSVARSLSRWYKSACAPIAESRKWCDAQLKRWERERLAAAQEERRKREAAANATQKAERDADVAHLQ